MCIILLCYVSHKLFNGLQSNLETDQFPAKNSSSYRTQSSTIKPHDPTTPRQSHTNHHKNKPTNAHTLS
jgi:hypothetical protein